MTTNLPVTRLAEESGFVSHDGTRLFFRHWPALSAAPDNAKKALVFLHRGHEHSGRVQQLVEQFTPADTAAFAWDARGHGYSPGERGDAPDFMCLVRDFEAFMQHLSAHYGYGAEQIVVIANSVGAVIAATWVHDYAPPLRGLAMAAAAFDINLYVPLAKPALRLATCFQPDLFVTSYIRPGMLTHSPQQASSYASDKLVTKNISARVLLDLADTAQRIVADAAALDVPVLMLVAGKDYVVKEKPQHLFFERISSVHKKYVRIPDAFHALLYEQDTQLAYQEVREFVQHCFALPLQDARRYLTLDCNGQSARAYQALSNGQSISTLQKLNFAIQKRMLNSLGRLSNGMHIGLETGFDSGSSLDYVYKNQAAGRWGIGKILDRGYLDAVGWRGIRERRVHLQQILSEAIQAVPAGQTVRILDLATGGGRYLLETVKRFGERKFALCLRDYAEANLQAAQRLATELGLADSARFEQCDAFDAASYQGDAQYDIVIVSGLFELFADNALILNAVRGITRVLAEQGCVIYTGQPWHPQLAMIAGTLNNHQGQPWVMRPRSQAELDALLAETGCRKVRSLIGLQGIFSVSLARRLVPCPAA